MGTIHLMAGSLCTLHLQTSKFIAEVPITITVPCIPPSLLDYFGCHNLIEKVAEDALHYSYFDLLVG